MATEAFRLPVSARIGDVSALFARPDDADRLLVLAHGAGAGMTHAFLETLVAGLHARGLATLRFQFPYTEAGNKRPDPPALLTATVRAAVAAGRERADGLPVFAGGKSLGGRMTSTAAAQDDGLEGIEGLAFVGFPLHPPKKPGIERADHLASVRPPMLFLQGTRDALADLALLAPVVEKLGARATLHVVEGGDHSFHVLKRSGRTDEEVQSELADAIDRWTNACLAA